MWPQEHLAAAGSTSLEASAESNKKTAGLYQVNLAAAGSTSLDASAESNKKPGLSHRAYVKCTVCIVHCTAKVEVWNE